MTKHINMYPNDAIKLISIYFSGQVFGYRVGEAPYSWINYREAEKTIQSFRRGLVKIGLAGYRIFIYNFDNDSSSRMC